MSQFIAPTLASPGSQAGGKAVTLQFSDNTLLPLLLGDHDRHMVRIEQALGVRMSCRGNRVAIAGFAVGQQRSHPMRRRREPLAIHKYVVANQERVLHGTGGDFEGLENKRNDEQAGDQHSRDGGEEFDGRFLRLLVLLDFFLFFFVFPGHSYSL